MCIRDRNISGVTPLLDWYYLEIMVPSKRPPEADGESGGSNMNKGFDKATFKRTVLDNVKNMFRRTIDEATPQQVFQAVAYACLLYTSSGGRTRCSRALRNS